MSIDAAKLGDLWRVRNAAAQTLALTEEQMRRAIREASHDVLVELIDGYSPALSTGPEWTRTFDPLVERLWAWRDDATMAALAATFKERGITWGPVVNALSPENGARLRTGLRHPAWARLPAFATA
jgi:hypothetical protein